MNPPTWQQVPSDEVRCQGLNLNTPNLSAAERRVTTCWYTTAV